MRTAQRGKKVFTISFIVVFVIILSLFIKSRHFNQTTPIEFDSAHWIKHPMCRERMIDDLVSKYQPFSDMCYEDLTKLLGEGGKWPTIDLVYNVEENLLGETIKYIGFNFGPDGKCVWFDISVTVPSVNMTP